MFQLKTAMKQQQSAIEILEFLLASDRDFVKIKFYNFSASKLLFM